MTREDRQIELQRARARADLARIRFDNAAHAVVGRLTPERLREDAIEVATDSLEMARQNLMARFKSWPFLLAAALVALLAMLLWTPARLIFREGARVAQVAWTLKQLWRATNDGS